MKNVTQTICLFSLILILASSCNPYTDNPADDQLNVGANVANEVIHAVPDPKCGFDMMAQLVFETGGQDVLVGEVELVNSKEYMHVIFLPQSGLSVSTAAVWRGNHSVYCENSTGGECQPPVDEYGNPDPYQFPYFDELRMPAAAYGVVIPLNELYEANSFCAFAQLVALDGSGSPIFSKAAWARGKSATTGVHKLDYILGACPDMECEPWIDSDNQCGAENTVACVVPSVAPGDDLSEYECTKGNGQTKFNVCHLPPGNPANMQSICIAESALDAHIIDFKPIDNPCMGHHSGCHIGPCDPCGPGSTIDQSAKDAADFAAKHGCTGN